MLLTSGFPNGPHIHHFPGLDLDERRRRHGAGRIDRSAPVRAGERLGLNLGFELGETAVPAGGHLRVVWLWPFDWAAPQAADPGGSDYVHASCSRPGVDLRVTCAFRGDLVPWNHQIDVEVVGELTRGDRVELACREWRAPTFVVPEAELLFLINPEGGRRWIQLPPAPGFAVAAGAPARLVALAPADGIAGEELELTLRVEDEWGNPLLVEGSAPEVVPAKGMRSVSVEQAGEMPAYRARVRIATPGTHRIEATLPAFGLQAVTNPVRITRERPPLRTFWGDLHAGQGQIGCGVGSVRHHFPLRPPRGGTSGLLAPGERPSRQPGPLGADTPRDGRRRRGGAVRRLSWCVGITAGTDGVSGRPGCDHPGSRLIRNARSGVTAFLASELTREALWEAMTARRCYATDGPRMRLEVTADGHLMGSEYAADGFPLVAVEAEGTAGIEQVDLLCGVEPLWTWRPAMAPVDGAVRVLWGGTEGHGGAPQQRALWKGRFIVDGGRIAKVEPVALVTPFDGVEQVDAHTVRFDTVTAGNRMGMCVEIEGGPAASCRFESGPATFDFALSQVREQPMRVEAGGASRHVIAGPAPNPELPPRVELSCRDTRAVAGLCAYWVQVTQIDQHRAWSSPIYVERRSG